MRSPVSLLLLAPLVLAFNAVPRTTLTDCLNSANVPVLMTTSADWAQEISPYNLRFNYKPAVVAMPSTLQHVQDSVKCASKTGTKVAARGGGHSYAAYGLGGQDGSLMIDMVNFQTISLDKTSNIVTVGAGVRLGNLALKIFNDGGRGMPHGTCPGVGISGHALFGGFGLDSRMWGLATDMIQELTVVLANGTAVTASASQNKDLYWAMRGAGPNFGVATQFKMKTFAAPSDNTNWAYTYTISDPNVAAQAYKIMQDWGQTSAPSTLGYGIETFGGNSLIIRGVYYGTQDKFQTIINPLLAQLQPVAGTPQASVKTEGWIASLTDLASPDTTLVTPVKGYNEHDTFYAKSIVTDSSKPLSLDALKKFFNYIYKGPPSGVNFFVINNLYGGPNSAINAVPPPTDAQSTSSYAHRTASYVWQFYAYASPWNPAAQTFVQGMKDSLGPEGNLPAYAPYVDSALTRTDALNKYYGASLPRLQSIKKAVDPKDVFWNPQSIL